MELFQATQEVKSIFHIEDISELPQILQSKIDNNTLIDCLTSYYSIFQNEEDDYIQKIYQYNLANRKQLMQDYTPDSLSKLLAEMIETEPNSIYDVCSGSGSLSIAIHKKFPNAFYVLHELDDHVIPFLIFNLALNNFEAVVIHGDVNTGEQFNIYVLKKGKYFSSIKKTEKYELEKYDVVVSNPPFNVKNFKCNIACGQDLIKSNSNAFFSLYAFEHCINQAIIILYSPLVKKKEELLANKYFIDNNFLKRIIYNPTNFFDSTPTQTIIMELNRKKKTDDVYLQDCTYFCDSYIRDQNGQFGGKSHTNRTYHKKYNCYSDDQIEAIAHIEYGPHTWECYAHRLAENNYEIPTFATFINPLNLYCDRSSVWFASELYGISDIEKESIEKIEKEKKEKEERRLQTEYEKTIKEIAIASIKNPKILDDLRIQLGLKKEVK